MGAATSPVLPAPADGVLPLLVVNVRQDPICSEVAQPLDTDGHSQSVVYDARGNGTGSVVPRQSGDHASRPTDYTPVVVEKVAPPQAFSQNQVGDLFISDVVPTIGTNGNASGRNNLGGVAPAGVAEALLPFDTTQITSAKNYSNPKPGDPCHPLAAGAHPPAASETAKAGGCAPAAKRYVVRRFTCRETERLQAFPDDHTLIAWAGTKRKGADLEDQRAYLTASGYTAEQIAALVHCPDGPRYKAVGNSKAVTVVRWIGERIQQQEDLIRSGNGG